jgi:hypothetical protein
MSDVTPPPPPAEQPATPPTAPATPAYAPAQAGPKQALSLTSFILGLAALVFSWAIGFGFLVAVAAVVLGFLGKAKEPQAPKWMWLVGIITGFVAIFIALIVLIIWIVALASYGSLMNQYGDFSY